MDKVSDKILTKAEVMWHRRVVQTNSFFPNLNQNQDHVRKKSSKLNQKSFFPNQNQTHAGKKSSKSNQNHFFFQIKSKSFFFSKSKSCRKKIAQIKSNYFSQIKITSEKSRPNQITKITIKTIFLWFLIWI